MQLADPDPVHPCAVSAHAGLRRARADDVVAHAANLSGWQQRYDQLDAGAFRGAVDELWFDDLQVFRERTSHSVRQRCRIRRDTLWLGLTLRHDGSRVEGRMVGAGGVMACSGQVEFELCTPRDHDIVGIVVSQPALRGLARQLGVELDLARHARPGWLQADAATRARLQEGALLCLREAAADATLHTSERSRRHAQQALLEAVLGVLGATEPPSDARRSAARHQRLVQQVCESVLARPDQVPTVPELCERFHVSRRALQYAFVDALGSSPVSVLRSLRLNAVRRDLLRDPAPPVQDVAARWGFWSLSQFASDYRAQFGERPSDTRARARVAR